jgi:hypothetical protein
MIKRDLANDPLCVGPEARKLRPAMDARLSKLWNSSACCELIWIEGMFQLSGVLRNAQGCRVKL